MGISECCAYQLVGFADLGKFTSYVRRGTERELAVMVQRFERLASDIVTAHGGPPDDPGDFERGD